MNKKISILIVEDLVLIAQAWKKILSEVHDFEVIRITSNEMDTVKTALQDIPNVILMDINLKEGYGFDATQKITTQLESTKVIGVSIHDDLALVKKMYNQGAQGYVTKNSSTEELIEGIRTVVNGEEFICNEIKERYFKSMIRQDSTKELTEREIVIVKNIAMGLTSKQIGEKLQVSNRTVDTHRHNILKKLGLPNSAQLSIWAKNKGYV